MERLAYQEGERQVSKEGGGGERRVLRASAATMPHRSNINILNELGSKIRHTSHKITPNENQNFFCYLDFILPFCQKF